MIEEYLEYLEKLRPSKRKAIAGAWKLSAENISKIYPAILGWCQYQMIAKLSIAGLYSTHPYHGKPHLFEVLEVSEKELNVAINAQSIAALDRTLFVFIQRLKNTTTPINYQSLYLDMIYPNNRNRWRKEYAMRLKELENENT